MTLAEDHIGLALYVARRVRGPDREAIEGEALLGLVEAERAFDPSRGRFAALAGTVIRHRCYAEARRQRSRPFEESLTLTDENGHEHERPELAVPPAAHRSAFVSQVAALLAVLPDRERRVLVLRYGLEDGREWTLPEIGALLQLSPQRIGQIEARGLAVLRKHAQRRRRGQNR